MAKTKRGRRDLNPFILMFGDLEVDVLPFKSTSCKAPFMLIVIDLTLPGTDLLTETIDSVFYEVYFIYTS